MSGRRAIVGAGADVGAVLLFVVVGRRSHEEGLTLLGVVRTAAPFLLGLGAGWAATRAWRAPASLATGAGVWAGAVVGGLAVRALVFGEGIAPSFAVVTACVLGVLLVGWRLVAAGIRRDRPNLSLE